MRVLLVLSALAVASCAKQGHDAAKTEAAKTEKEPQPFKELTVEQVEQKLAGSPKPVVFDANVREVYDKRHIPGAIWVPEDQSIASIVPKDKNAPLIFYCANPH